MSIDLKKNFLYNVLLTISGYIFPFLTFPYISRILGAENVGLVNFAQSIIDYFILFSSLGVSVIGLREIAQCNEDKEKRDSVFSKLLSIHFTLSLILLIVYIAAVYTIPTLSEHQNLYWIGSSKIILNVFLVEWLFRGVQDFKYVTLRTIITRIIYVALVFLFVRTKDDYIIYFVVTMGQVFLNAVINWHYSHRYVSFKYSLHGSRLYLYPYILWGVNMILLSFYSTFNVMFLGFACGNKSVGYYTTATKLYAIILSIITAYNGVFIPYLNSMYAKGDIKGFVGTIAKSFSFVATMTVPLAVGCFCLAPYIITIIAGHEYEKSIPAFRIVLLQILVIGVSQITNSQILLPLRKDKQIFISTIAGALSMVIIVLGFVPNYAEIGASYAVLISHIIEFSFLLYFSKKFLNYRLPIKEYTFSFVMSIPIILICYLSMNITSNPYFVVLFACIVGFIYFVIIQFFIIKNQVFIDIYNKNIRR